MGQFEILPDLLLVILGTVDILPAPMNMINFSTAGLILDMIGVAIIFFFGPPPSVLFEDGGIILSLGEDPLEAKRARRNIRLSRFGLVLVFLGFALQAVGNYHSKH